MLDSKIDTVLKKIEEQEKFEQENPYETPNQEKLLAIGRNTGIFYNVLLKSKNAKKILEIGMSAGITILKQFGFSKIFLVFCTVNFKIILNQFLDIIFSMLRIHKHNEILFHIHHK